MPEPSADYYSQKPDGANAVLVLGDGSVFWGKGIGAQGEVVGEVCFNTSMTGYQEILTDPSYAGQIITFTFPHIGNVGANAEDIESKKPAARGLVLREDITEPSSWRAQQHLQGWLEQNRLVGICGIDTRAITRRIRDHGAPNSVIAFHATGTFDVEALLARARNWPGLNGMDLVPEVTTKASYGWDEGAWVLGKGYATQKAAQFHVVAIDYGAKRNILRRLVAAGCRVTVVPARATFEEIMTLMPDGVFLSNGPGDPAATGVYAVPVIKRLIEADMPMFGICLGHQLLGLALGGRTRKMERGHRGANQPVKDRTTGKVEITSQNHGFCVIPDSLPANAAITHHSLFADINEGISMKDRPVFSVQYHPEASPGPEDSHYLFERFVALMRARRAKAA